MTYQEFNDFCRALPSTSHVVQWGNSDVWKVGGKVFAIGGWEKSGQPAFSFKTSALNFDILKDEPGFRPAPYLASRGFKWIQLHNITAKPEEELRYYLQESHRLVALGLSKKKQKELGLNSNK
jgi:predicted DNA-binding protein (MmcQ/YjbR family)